MSNEQLRAREETRRQDSENARALSRLAGTDNSSDRVSNQTSSSTNDVKLRCDSAKQQAQIIRDRDSRILSVERLRQLDVWVESECKAK